ncbi:hypothetical protein T08_4175 [Trichinella sp. T8]|nr:hypothetical protein T08_4175 [Trichinella sp. T8]
MQIKKEMYKATFIPQLLQTQRYRWAAFLPPEEEVPCCRQHGEIA